MRAVEDNMQLDTDESNPSVHPQQCDPIEVEVLAVEDDSDDDIDWEQLTREAHADVESGNFDFISTHEDPRQAMVALKKYLDDILEEVEHEMRFPIS